MATPRRRGSSRGAGWDVVKPPIPGNVFACMQELGIEDIRQNQDEVSGKCPMHVKRLGKEDRHSSWSVQAEDGYFNCFSCGYRGNFAKLVRDVLDISWLDACAWIRQRGSIERVRKSLDRGLYIDDIDKPREDDTTLDINEAKLALYGPPPQDALDSRAVTAEVCDDLGILWSREKDCWILPVRDPETRELLGWQEKNKRYFRNRPRGLQKGRTLFGLDAFDSDYAVLVESPLDVARINTAMGLNCGLSSFGAEVTDEQMSLLLATCDTLIVALDRDKAGDRVSEEIRRTWARRGVVMRFFNYDVAPDAKDPGDMTDEEIVEGIETAYSSILARF